MRNELQKFNETVQILVQAFFNDTLQKANSHACAVGNMVAYANDLSYRNSFTYPEKKVYIDAEPEWQNVFMTVCGHQSFDTKYYRGITAEQIDSTGYSPRELARIEFAFETASSFTQDGMFNGLMAVVEVLADIHKVDLTVKESAKSLFVKAL